MTAEQVREKFRANAGWRYGGDESALEEAVMTLERRGDLRAFECCRRGRRDHLAVA